MPYIAELLRPWQVQHEYGAPIYRGMRHAFAKIVAEDGLQSLWRYGFAAFVGRDLIYSGLRIGLYPSVRALYSGGQAREEVTLLPKVLSGCTTGVVGSAIASPGDLVRRRHEPLYQAVLHFSQRRYLRVLQLISQYITIALISKYNMQSRERCPAGAGADIGGEWADGGRALRNRALYRAGAAVRRYRGLHPTAAARRRRGGLVAR